MTGLGALAASFASQAGEALMAVTSTVQVVPWASRQRRPKLTEPLEQPPPKPGV
jgi:hypothetical protein